MLRKVRSRASRDVAVDFIAPLRSRLGELRPHDSLLRLHAWSSENTARHRRSYIDSREQPLSNACDEACARRDEKLWWWATSA